MDNNNLKNSEIEECNPNTTTEKFNCISADNKPRRNSLLFRSKRNIIITTICLVVVVTICVLWSSGVVFNGIANNIYDSYKAEEIACDKAISKLNIVSKFGNIQWAYDKIADDVYNKFLKDEITYDRAVEILSKIDKAKDRDLFIEKCNALKNSRDAYEKGVNLKNENDYINSIIEFEKVIQDDFNYNNAQTEINEIKEIAKTDLLQNLETMLTERNYSGGLEMISDYKKVCTSDEKINNYESQFNKIKEEEDLKKKINACDLTKESGIEEYLNLKYGELKGTPLGDWKFEIDVMEMRVEYSPEDYYIRAYIKDGADYELRLDMDTPVSKRIDTDKQLKNYMLTIAKDITNKLPGKKFNGKYVLEHHFMNKKDDYTEYFYEWRNYASISGNYYQTPATGFKWAQSWYDGFCDGLYDYKGNLIVSY